MLRACDKALICDGDPDSPLSGFESELATPASSACGNAINCAGVDDPFANFSSEFDDDASFFDDIFDCACVGDSYFLKIKAPGFIGPFSWFTIGDVPPGLVITPNNPSEGSLTIVGGFTLHGHYEFKIAVQDGWGNLFEKKFIYNILQILTNDLPVPVIGVPYNFQLVAIGGSGHYAWQILSGSLPQGLIMDTSGAIEGTPTKDPENTVTFRVVDTDCVSVDETFLPPKAELVGRATTRVATLYGYSEYVPSSPPKKYKQLTWSGFATQSFEFPVLIPGRCLTIFGGITMNYTGTSIQGELGEDIQARQMDGDTGCQSFPWLVPAGRCLGGGSSVRVPPNDGPIVTTPCGSLGFTFWHGDVEGINSRDVRWPGFFYDTFGAVDTPTNRDVVAAGTAETVYNPDPRVAALIGLVSYHNDYHIVLSDEYTEAEALTHAVIAHSAGLVAQRGLRGNSFTFQQIDVEFDLVFTRLQEDIDYEGGVSFIDSDGTVTTKTYNFTCPHGATTYKITDTIPTPAPGHFTFALLPTINYAIPTP